MEIIDCPQPFTRNMAHPSIAVVVPIGHRPIDLPLLNRFLRALQASDFPRDFMLFTPVTDWFENRAFALERVLTTKFEYVLFADNDVVVPTVWWKYISKYMPPASIVTLQERYDDTFMVVDVLFLIDQLARPGHLMDITYLKHYCPPERLVRITDFDIQHDKNVN